jgi:hypothetical protein
MKSVNDTRYDLIISVDEKACTVTASFAGLTPQA